MTARRRWASCRRGIGEMPRHRRIDYTRDYPPTWRAMVAQVRERGGNRCEGSPCYPACRAENGKPHPVTGSRVMLTTAHLHEEDDTRTMTDIARLAHLCQRCHLTLDAPMHARRAAETRRLRRISAGQLEMGVY